MQKKQTNKQKAAPKKSVKKIESKQAPKKKDDTTGNLVLTNTEKIYFPKHDYTKGDVLAYYDKIAAIMLPYLKDRPQSLNRHPNGVREEGFFQKNITQELPSFASTFDRVSDSTEEHVNYLICNNKETLLYMANLGCIEINPWNSRITNADKPDWMVIDLDPGENTMDELILVTKEVKKVLDLSCEKSFVKTSGKTGIHIYVPLQGEYAYEEIKNFCLLLCQLVHNALPDITSLERSPSKRKKKIYLDYLQNNLGQTIAAPYSLRPTDDATVSTPLLWSEVKKGLDPSKFTLKTIWKRLGTYGDLWSGVLTEKVDLKKAIVCLEKNLEKMESSPIKKEK